MDNPEDKLTKQQILSFMLLKDCFIPNGLPAPDPLRQVATAVHYANLLIEMTESSKKEELTEYSPFETERGETLSTCCETPVIIFSSNTMNGRICFAVCGKCGKRIEEPIDETETENNASNQSEQ